jgi:hypothetical protein
MKRRKSPQGKSLVASMGIAMLAALFGTVGSPAADAATVLTFSPLPHRMETALQGSMCRSPNTCTEVAYDFSMPLSVKRLTAAIDAATSTSSEPESGVVMFGLSGGAGAAGKWMRNHAGDVDAPSPDILSFVVIGNPGRKYGGSSRRFATDPVTQYQVIDIARQYDPIADSPDDPFNFLAHLNVMAGMLSPLHTDYSDVDIDDPRNIRWVEGNTTYILVPTAKLPLLAGLRALGLGALAESLDGRLREIIERGYNRPPNVDAALDALQQQDRAKKVTTPITSHDPTTPKAGLPSEGSNDSESADQPAARYSSDVAVAGDADRREVADPTSGMHDDDDVADDAAVIDDADDDAIGDADEDASSSVPPDESAEIDSDADGSVTDTTDTVDTVDTADSADSSDKSDNGE